ncbi:hypothetical protein [Rhodococcus pyridinivorans]|uniref:hypothetical protein n=1 Tax=Rhodococcus pyridinivorans TaxID=103816 RepID=UPI003AADB052
MSDPIETATAFHLDLMPAPGTTEYQRLIQVHTGRDIDWPIWTFISLGAIIAALLIL